MIHCPSCGTANRDGSKFCNECGHDLGESHGVRCPMCGTTNAHDDLFCVDCGARLVSVDEGADERSQPAMVIDDELHSSDQTIVPDDDTELPEWLDRLRGATQREEGAVEAEDLPRDEVASEEPRWVASQPADADQPTIVQDEEGAAQAESSDDWLARLRQAAAGELDQVAPPSEVPFEPAEPTPDETTQPSELPQGQDGAELPDWLSELRQGLRQETEATEADVSEVDVVEGEVEPAERDTGGLAWLEEVVAGQPDELEAERTAAILPPPLPPAEEPEPVSISEQPELPAGSLESEEEPILALDKDEDLTGETVSWEEEILPPPEPATDIPDWLRQMEPPPEIEAGAIESVSDEAPLLETEGSESELPDWLETAAIGGAKLTEEEELVEGGLAKADIPNWLVALRPDSEIEGDLAFDELGEESELAGALSGLRDVIPIELSTVTPPDTKRLGNLLGAMPEEDIGANQFTEVIEATLPPQSAPKSKVTRFSVLRPLMWLVLVLAICVPLITNWQFFDSSPQIPTSVETAYSAVDVLMPGSAVVVAYDFDPSTAGEMEPIADVLIDHLMKKEVRIIAVSLMPAGPALAQRSMDRVATLHPDYVYGTRYVNLGYLPGREAALRSFLADPFGATRVDYVTGEDASTLSGLHGLSTLDDVSLIVELGAGQQSVRWWVEQVGSQTTIPIIAGVSAAVEPYIRPYYEGASPQIQGLISGLANAAGYGVLIGGRTVSVAELEALNWAAVLAALVILAGIITSLFVRGEKRNKS